MINPARRAFLKAGGLALVSMGMDPVFLRRVASAANGVAAARKKTLICVFQRGAVDGLSMIVPHGDSDYYRNRGRIAVPRPGDGEGALDLDGFFGLHPAMEELMPLFGSGTLAPVHAVGSPNATRSHFDAQDFMESGTPGTRSTNDGWLNRYLAHSDLHAAPFRGVSIGPRLPRIMRGPASAIAITDLDRVGIAPRAPTSEFVTEAFSDLYSNTTGIIGSSSAEAFEAIEILRASERPPSAPGVSYPRNQFGNSMSQLARLIKMDVGLEIGFASLGGWDTHANQGAAQGQLANNLRQFASTLSAFVRDLGDRMADVVILTMSEFGRTVAENGNSGTDHGHATAMMVMGGNSAGGRVHGTWPTLATEKLYEGRDLEVTTDFRDLFTEVLVKHLGAQTPEGIFPGHRPVATNWPGVIA